MGVSEQPGLHRRALTLGTANSFDYAMQFLLPVVLVRCLAPADFGLYRLLWLTVTTVLAMVPLSMPQSLYFFLPRSEPEARRLYVHQTLLYLAVVSLAGGLAVSAWSPLQPPAIDGLNRFGWLLPALVALWVTSALLDVLPTIEERVTWQATATISLTALRAVALGTAAWLSGDLGVLIALLVGLAVVKLALLLFYIAEWHGLRGVWAKRDSFVEQFRHAAPFGMSSALFTLRAQADQWVAATLFAVHSFAAFSIAAVLGPLINLFRMSVNHAFLPSMSRQHAAGDLDGMLELNSQANVLVGRMVYPLLAFAFVFAEDMVRVVYTEQYIEAASVMRVYLFALAALVVELFSITLLLKEGVFALRLNLAVLMLSVVLSWLGARAFGLPGAAIGSVLMLYVDRFATLRRIARRLDRPILHLQDWRTLGLVLASAVAAGAAAWGASFSLAAQSPPMLRMALGGAVLAAVYGVLHWLLAAGSRRWSVEKEASTP